MCNDGKINLPVETINSTFVGTQKGENAMKKKEKETKTKMTYLERCEQDKERWRQIRKSPKFYYLCLLPVFWIVAYFLTTEVMGEQALTYSETEYQNIKTVMENSVKEGFGIDSKILQEGVDIEEEIDGKKTGHIDHYEGLDWYDDSYSKETHILKAGMKKGYFEPTVSVLLDENFHMSGYRKNFGTARDYFEHFRGDQFKYTFIYGSVAWLIPLLLWNIVNALVVDFLKNCQKVAGDEAMEVKEEAKTAESMQNEQVTETVAETEKTETEISTEISIVEIKTDDKVDEVAELAKEAEIKEFPKEVISL